MTLKFYKTLYEASFSEEERIAFGNFITNLENYQSNHYGTYDRQILLDSYINLPDTIKKKIANTKKDIYRGADGLSYRAVVSFTTNKKYAETFGTYLLPLSLLSSYVGMTNTDKIVKLAKSMKIKSNIGDDEGEILVFDPNWKEFDIEDYRI